MSNFIKASLYLILVVLIATTTILAIRCFDPLANSKNPRPLSVIFIGLAILITGMVLIFWAIISLLQNQIKIIKTERIQPQDIFITSGPYKFSRNPLYLAATGILLGLVLIFGSLLGFFLLFYVL